MKKRKKLWKLFDYIWPVVYAIIMLFGIALMPASQNPEEIIIRIIGVVFSIIGILFGVIRLRKTNLKQEEMLDDYEKLYLNNNLSNEEIDSIMKNKYGKNYDKF